LYTRTQLVLGPALNVTVREGDKAVMPCIAPHLGDKTVESSLSHTNNKPQTMTGMKDAHLLVISSLMKIPVSSCNQFLILFFFQVSWIRQKDLAILISGDHVYTRYLISKNKRKLPSSS
jgi:hypothetical protein